MGPPGFVPDLRRAALLSLHEVQVVAPAPKDADGGRKKLHAPETRTAPSRDFFAEPPSDDEEADPAK